MENNLRRLRKQKRMSQIALQMATGIDPALLSKYENGRRLPPDGYADYIERFLSCEYWLHIVQNKRRG